MATLYDRQGNPVNVPDDQVISALSSGQLGLPQNQPIPMIAPDGGVYEMPINEAIGASQEGWIFEGAELRRQRELQEQYGDIGGQALSAITGAGRGLTFGLSDWALTKGLGVDPQTLRDLEEANPTASLVGEIGAVVPAALMTGGAGATRGLLRAAATGPRAAARAGLGVEKAAAKLVAPMAERGLFGRMASRAISTGAGSAVEGALYGGGQFLSEAALGNIDLTAENLISNVGMGAALGGGLGAALGGAVTGVAELGKGVGRITRKSMDSMVDMWERQTGQRALPGFRDLAYRAWGKIAGFSSKKGDDIAGLATPEGAAKATQDIESFLDDAAREGRKYEDPTMKSFGELSKYTREYKPGEIKKQMPLGVGDQALDNYDSLMTSIDQDLKKIIAGVGEYGDIPTARKLSKQINAIDNKIDTAAIKSDELTAEIFTRLDTLKRDLGKKAERLGRVAKDSLDLNTYEEYFTIYHRIRDLLEDDKIFGDMAIAQRTLNQPWAEMLKSLGYRAKNRIHTVVGKEQFQKVWGADPAGFKSFFKGLGRAENDLDLEHWTKLWQDRLAVARAHQKAYRWTPDGNPVEMGHLRTIEENTRSLEKLLAKAQDNVGLHNQLKSLEEMTRSSGFGAEIGGIGGYVIGGPAGALAGYALGSVMNPARMIRQLATIDRMASNAGNAIKRSIDGYVRKASKLKPGKPISVKRLVAPVSVGFLQRSTGEKDRDKAFKKTVEKLTKIASDPNYTMEMLEKSVAPIQDAAPQLSMKVQLKTRQAASYLLEKTPKNPSMRPTMFAKDWKPSKIQLAKFERIAQAVEDPKSVLKDLESGNLTTESVEALKEIYPEIYKRIVYQLTENMDKLQNLPYQERLRLSILFDVPLEPTLEPAFVAAMQQAQTRPDPSSIGAPPRVTTKRGPGIEQNMSQSQRLQAKG